MYHSPRLSPAMALVPLPFGRFGAYASTFRHRRGFLHFRSKSLPLDTYLLVVLAILGLSAGLCENGFSLRKSVAGFLLQLSLQTSLENHIFGRSLVQLILAAKEGGFLPASCNRRRSFVGRTVTGGDALQAPLAMHPLRRLA